MGRTAALAFAVAAFPAIGAAQQIDFNIVSETLSLSKSEIADAHWEFVNAQPAVRLKLKPDVAARFGDLTGRNISKKMQVVIDGRVIIAAVIMSAITGGEVVISGGLTMAEAEEIAKRFK